MTISVEAINRIFNAMLSCYGTDFTRRHSSPGTSQEAVLASMKSEWAHRLSNLGDADGFAAIAWALDNLPDNPPNSVQFRNLCRQAPASLLPARQQQELPPADPARIRAELAKLGRPQVKPRVGRDLSWAHRIMSRHEGGETITKAVLDMAKQALKLEGRPLAEERA